MSAPETTLLNLAGPKRNRRAIQQKKTRASSRKSFEEPFFDPIKEGERVAEISIKAFREALDKADAHK